MRVVPPGKKRRKEGDKSKKTTKKGKKKKVADGEGKSRSISFRRDSGMSNLTSRKKEERRPAITPRGRGEGRNRVKGDGEILKLRQPGRVKGEARKWDPWICRRVNRTLKEREKKKVRMRQQGKQGENSKKDRRGLKSCEGSQEDFEPTGGEPNTEGGPKTM